MTKSAKVPAEYQTVMTYLIIPEADKFIKFTEKVFHATEKMRHLRDEHTIMHAEIVIGEVTIMLADATEQYTPRPAGFFIYVDNADETYKKALEEGATSIMPPTDQQYGRSGGVTDAHGNTWWITSVIE